MMIIKIISSKILTVGELFKFSIFRFSDLDAVAVLVAIVHRKDVYHGVFVELKLWSIYETLYRLSCPLPP